MGSKNLGHRYVILGIFLAVFVVICAVVLFNLQIIKGDEYREAIINQTERSYPIMASRGEILDTYGRPLVTNRMGYYIRIQDVAAGDSEINKTIEILLEIMEKNDVEFIDELPIKTNPLRFEFKDENSNKKAKKWKKENGFDENASAKKVIDELAKEYGVTGDYSEKMKRDIVSVRYAMEKKNFGVVSPYTFATDVSMEVVQEVSERSYEMTGVSVEIEPVREYVNGSMAVHILGRT